MGQRFKTSDSNMQTQTQTQSNPLDVLQQFDALLKNHSIMVHDRENLAKLFENIVDLCTQMPKTKLKAALKAATQEPKTKTQPKPKAQSKPKAQPKEVMVGPDGAGDAPMISDLPVVPLARGRGRPRKVVPETTVAVAAVAEANANPNAETAEKKRRGRPKKDKSVTISSNDDEDALIAQMMADVASMQKEDELSAQAAASAAVASAAVSVVIPDPDDEEDSVCSVLSEFTGPLMRCEEMTPRADSASPVIHASSASFQQLEVEVSVSAEPAKAPKAKAPKAAKEPVVKAPKAPKAAKEPVVKAPKDPKAAKEPVVKAPKAKANTKAQVAAAAEEVVVAPLASFPALDAPLVIQTQPQHATSGPENKESNGKIYLMAMIPTTSFSYSGKTYLRTETDNVYDNLTHELIGVWDHSNHEIIAAFDDEELEELWFSDEE